MGRTRFAEFLAWRGCSQQAIATELGVSQTLISQILLGAKRPGLETAHAIETLSGARAPDGKLWAKGPIRTEEWLSDAGTHDTVRGHCDPVPDALARLEAIDLAHPPVADGEN